MNLYLLLYTNGTRMIAYGDNGLGYDIYEFATSAIGWQNPQVRRLQDKPARKTMDLANEYARGFRLWLGKMYVNDNGERMMARLKSEGLAGQLAFFELFAPDGSIDDGVGRFDPAFQKYITEEIENARNRGLIREPNKLEKYYIDKFLHVLSLPDDITAKNYYNSIKNRHIWIDTRLDPENTGIRKGWAYVYAAALPDSIFLSPANFRDIGFIDTGLGWNQVDLVARQNPYS